MIGPIEETLRLGETSTEALILELRNRGFRVVPHGGRDLNWNRMMEKNFNEEAFKWEAAHKIGGMIEPKHLVFTTSNLGLVNAMRGALYFR